MSNNEEDPRPETREIERLRNENAVLRSLIHEKSQCTNCCTDDSIRRQLEENQKQLFESQKQLVEHKKQLEKTQKQLELLRTELAEMKTKQQTDMDESSRKIDRMCNWMNKHSKDKQAKTTQKNPDVGSASKTEEETPVTEVAPSVPSAPSASPAPLAPPAPPAPPVPPAPPAPSEKAKPSALSSLPTASEPAASPPVPPKAKSLHEKFAGIWKISSTDDCERYISFQKLDKDEYFKDLDFDCDGKYLQIPPEPEVVANPFLQTDTRFEDNILRTVLSKEGGEKIDDVHITRTLKGDNQMVIKTVINAFYNLTNSRQVISCTRVYDRAT